VLLAAYNARRATRDIDFAARAVKNDVENILEIFARLCLWNLTTGLFTIFNH
jgi:hypothetical protein